MPWRRGRRGRRTQRRRTETTNDGELFRSMRPSPEQLRPSMTASINRHGESEAGELSRPIEVFHRYQYLMHLPPMTTPTPRPWTCPATKESGPVPSNHHLHVDHQRGSSPASRAWGTEPRAALLGSDVLHPWSGTTMLKCDAQDNASVQSAPGGFPSAGSCSGVQCTHASPRPPPSSGSRSRRPRLVGRVETSKCLLSVIGRTWSSTPTAGMPGNGGPKRIDRNVEAGLQGRRTGIQDRVGLAVSAFQILPRLCRPRHSGGSLGYQYQGYIPAVGTHEKENVALGEHWRIELSFLSFARCRSVHLHQVLWLAFQILFLTSANTPEFRTTSSCHRPTEERSAPRPL